MLVHGKRVYVDMKSGKKSIKVLVLQTFGVHVYHLLFMLITHFSFMQHFAMSKEWQIYVKSAERELFGFVIDALQISQRN